MVAEAVDEDKLRLGHAVRLSGEAAVQQSPSNMEGVSPSVCQDVPAKILYTGSCHPRQMCPLSRRSWLLKLIGIGRNRSERFEGCDVGAMGLDWCVRDLVFPRCLHVNVCGPLVAAPSKPQPQLDMDVSDDKRSNV